MYRSVLRLASIVFLVSTAPARGQSDRPPIIDMHLHAYPVTPGEDVDFFWLPEKMEAPETRALVRFLNDWDPAVTIDTHTTNGSYHRYTVTYSGPAHPAGDVRIIEFVRDEMLPAVSSSLRVSKGWRTFPYLITTRTAFG